MGLRARPRRPGPRSPRRRVLEIGASREPARLQIFVYGSLKRGQSNHERFCRGFLATRDAAVRGWLYELPFGFPGLVVPGADVRAVGTTNYLADVGTQSRIRADPQESSRGWDTVHGELFSFNDPEERLPAFDGLEGFRPGEESLYERVLIPATLAQTGTVILAWAYVADSASGIYLPGGRWPPP